MNICTAGRIALVCKVLVPKHETRQWPQNVLVAIVFFTATLVTVKKKKKPVSLKNVIVEIIKSIPFIKS